MGRHRKPKPLITCKQCNKQFEGRLEAKFCSADCRDSARRMKIECKCKRCSKVFMPKKRDRTEFCTRACFYRLTRMRKLSKARIERPEPPAPTVYIKNCCKCGELFETTYSATINCKRSECITKRHALSTFLKSRYTDSDGNRTCRFCCNKFGYERFYSVEVCNSELCIQKRQKEKDEIRRQYKREQTSKAWHIRRAIKNNRKHFNVVRKEVFIRDGYRCQLCKRKTRPDYHFNHPLYPNLDHIIPLARGGEHAMTNLQCLCRECNCFKSDKLTPDQLRMFA